VHLRPLGLLHGRMAREARAAGIALGFGHGDGAFTWIEVIRRRGRALERRLVPATAREQLVLLGPRVAMLLDRLSAPVARPLGLAADRPLIMGVVNVTPDSFSDGGLHLDPAAAIAHGLRLHHEGADIVDVGGESTRPGSRGVALEEELDRVLPVVEALVKEGVRVSIDTRKALVMRRAVAAGAVMINDVSALRHDPDGPAVAAACGVPVLLMHAKGDPRTMQDDPTYDHAPLDVLDMLEGRIVELGDRGIGRERILVDPGIGFGKTLAHNLQILASLGLLRTLGVPLVLGVSRKSFIGRISGQTVAEARLPGSLAAGLAGVAQGVDMLRVHDVRATREALSVWQAIAAIDLEP
jgi:dihydropteroate synthase